MPPENEEDLDLDSQQMPVTLDPETKRLKRKVDELTALFEITRRLRAPFDLDELLDEILKICQDLLDAEACSIWLSSEDRRLLHFHIARGGKVDELRKVPPLGFGDGSVVGWVAANAETVLVQDVSRDPRFSDRIDRVTGFETRQILCTPLLAGEEVIGVCEILNKKENRPFSTRDRRLFEMMAEQAAVAIDHIRSLQKRRAEERMAMIGRMSSSIIHDLKNPMSAIKGFAQLIGNRSPEHRAYTDIIMNEIDRLVGMTRELLDFSKGVSQLQYEEISVGDYLRDVVSFLERDFHGSGIEIVLDLAYEGAAALDVWKLRRAIFNLASNARDAMEEASERHGHRFTISSSIAGGALCLDFADTGSGMDQATARRIFEPFYSTKKGTGTGLGTTIVKSIVEAHGGSVALDSVPGRGTRFTLRLPLRPAAAGGEGKAPSAPVRTSGGTGHG